MRSEHDGGELRRYVLGTATDDECDVVEREYFEHGDALDRVSAAEDDLIDDYLSNRLANEERQRFERDYLSTPRHRSRVAVAREIRTAASARSVERREPIRRWSAVAAIAATLLIVAGGSWIVRSRFPSGLPATKTAPTVNSAPPNSSPSTGVGSPNQQRPAPPSSPSRPPVVIAVSISPILVRGADEASTAAIGPGTDVVRLLLQQGDRGERPLGEGRAIVRTVAGGEVWRGPAVKAAGSPLQEIARVDIPATLLGRDDYIIELLGADARGRLAERHRYFLRVRSP